MSGEAPKKCPSGHIMGNIKGKAHQLKYVRRSEPGNKRSSVPGGA